MEQNSQMPREIPEDVAAFITELGESVDTICNNPDIYHAEGMPFVQEILNYKGETSAEEIVAIVKKMAEIIQDPVLAKELRDFVLPKLEKELGQQPESV